MGAIFGLNAEGLAVARALHMAKARKQRGSGSVQRDQGASLVQLCSVKMSPYLKYFEVMFSYVTLQGEVCFELFNDVQCVDGRVFGSKILGALEC